MVRACSFIGRHAESCGAFTHGGTNEDVIGAAATWGEAADKLVGDVKLWPAAGLLPLGAFGTRKLLSDVCELPGHTKVERTGIDSTSCATVPG